MIPWNILTPPEAGLLMGFAMVGICALPFWATCVVLFGRIREHDCKLDLLVGRVERIEHREDG